MVNTKSVVRYMVDQTTRFIGWARRNQRVRQPADRLLKVNLGCGLSVAPGWVNIDGSLNALFATAPRFLHPIAYKMSGASGFYSKDFYCETLSQNNFVHHNLAYSIPLEDRAADFIYSSHFLEHLDKESGRRLLEECWRVLKPGGVLRIGVPDLEYAWQMYQHGEKDRMLHDYFWSLYRTAIEN